MDESKTQLIDGKAANSAETPGEKDDAGVSSMESPRNDTDPENLDTEALLELEAKAKEVER